jgi:hypothetical protein
MFQKKYKIITLKSNFKKLQHKVVVFFYIIQN